MRERLADKALVIIKPCALARKIGGLPMRSVIETMFADSGLVAVRSLERRLTVHEVAAIYPQHQLETIAPSGDEWKNDLLNHMCSSAVPIYDYSGKRACDKAQAIKKNVREQYANEGTYRTLLLENLLHVTDETDYLRDYDLLFHGSFNETPEHI